MDFIGVAFLIFGLAFFVVGAVGIIRLPDAYSRLHASGKVGTVGLFGVLIGAAFLLPGSALKALFLGIFMLFAGPLVSHAIGTASGGAEIEEQQSTQVE